MAASTSPTDSTAPKSTHVADPTLQPFLQPTFDPADYLNATLPSLSLSSVSSRALKQGQSATLADLSSQTQDLLSQLKAHTTRLSTILTQLTDDILRSGGRLAYEVEVLRGETIGLTETLTEGLKDDVSKFLPGGISIASKTTSGDNSPESKPSDHTPKTADATQQPPPSDPTASTPTPPHISQLATLHTIRSRLESVIRIFGEAMHWTLPPSEVSLTSSLISVSSNPSEDLESRGREFAASLRSEISDLITGAEDGAAGAEAAAVRIQALRDLAQVWKGTAEEKARVKFVDGLVRLAEEKGNVWNTRQQQQRAGGRARGESNAQKGAPPVPAVQKSGGFLDNLQRLREEFL